MNAAWTTRCAAGLVCFAVGCGKGADSPAQDPQTPQDKESLSNEDPDAAPPVSRDAGTPSDGALEGGVDPFPQCVKEAPGGAIFYVSISGDDGGDGSAERPFATINHAIQRVPDGSTILVRAGRYAGSVRLDRRLSQGIVVRSETPYGARLRHDSTVVRAFYGSNITLEGFDISHSGDEVATSLVHIQNLGGDEAPVQHITLRDNVIHDSRAADLVKINNGARYIRLEGNMLYNQTAPDEHVDIDSALHVTVEGNVFFNDHAGSGRYNDNDTGSFIAIKGEGAGGVQGAQWIDVRRNIFLNWEGHVGSGFILLGAYGRPFFEAEDIVIENNLMLGNARNRMRAPLIAKAAIDVVFRHNTISGDLPAAAYALRLAREGDNPPNDNLRFYNNIWADPTPTMEDFSDSLPEDTTSFLLSNNVYYNGGRWMPADEADHVNIWDDARRIVGDPALRNPMHALPPRLDPETMTFADGSTSICDAFFKLATAYCTTARGSVARQAALPEQFPGEDLMGNAPAPGATPDVGACQHVP